MLRMAERWRLVSPRVVDGVLDTGFG